MAWSYGRLGVQACWLWRSSSCCHRREPNDVGLAACQIFRHTAASQTTLTMRGAIRTLHLAMVHLAMVHLAMVHLGGARIALRLVSPFVAARKPCIFAIFLGGLHEEGGNYPDAQCLE